MTDNISYTEHFRELIDKCFSEMEEYTDETPLHNMFLKGFTACKEIYKKHFPHLGENEK